MMEERAPLLFRIQLWAALIVLFAHYARTRLKSHCGG
jgi:hypothetical protein